MSFEDDMIEGGFSDEQSYLDNLFDKAESAWSKQEEREKKQQQWDDYIENLSAEEAEDLKREEEERRRQKRLKNQFEQSEREKYYVWAENNSEEDKIWRASYGFMCAIDYYSECPRLLDEAAEWRKWLKERDLYAQWSEEHLEELNVWRKEREKEDVVDVFWAWSTYDHCEWFDEVWTSFLKWKNAHLKEWGGCKDKILCAWDNDYNYELLAWKFFFSNWFLDRFEFWKVENKEEWEEWKQKNKTSCWSLELGYLKSSDYYYFPKWIEEHLEVWHDWKKKNLDLWIKWESEFQDFWKRIINTDPIELWKNCNYGEWFSARRHRLDFDLDERFSNLDSEEICELCNNFDLSFKNSLKIARVDLWERSECRFEKGSSFDVVPLDLWKSWKNKNKNYWNNLKICPTCISEKCKTESEIHLWIANLCEKKGGLLWIKENYSKFSEWKDLYLWEKEWYPDNWGVYNNWVKNIERSRSIDDALFEFWREKNQSTWHEWKATHFEEWKSRLDELNTWREWVSEHIVEWNNWADKNIVDWTARVESRVEDDYHNAWRKFHFGGLDDFRSWKNENIEDWEMWKREFDSLIEKERWGEDYGKIRYD